MASTGVWETMYLRCLEMDNVNDGTEQSLKALTDQLMSISESLPEDIDPVDQFELFVTSKLCKSAGHIIDNFLDRKDDINKG